MQCSAGVEEEEEEEEEDATAFACETRPHWSPFLQPAALQG
jgi:hypothetical protein